MADDDIRHLPRLGIGDAMKLFGVTARALHFYEEVGLIEAQRNRSNHRFYDPAARRRLEWIAPLRAAGLPLDDIREVLQSDERDGLGLQVALARLHDQRARLCRTLKGLDAAIGALGAIEQCGARARS